MAGESVRRRPATPAHQNLWPMLLVIYRMYFGASPRWMISEYPEKDLKRIWRSYQFAPVRCNVTNVSFSLLFSKRGQTTRLVGLAGWTAAYVKRTAPMRLALYLNLQSTRCGWKIKNRTLDQPRSTNLISKEATPHKYREAMQCLSAW